MSYMTCLASVSWSALSRLTTQGALGGYSNAAIQQSIWVLQTAGRDSPEQKKLVSPVYTV